MSGPQEMRSNPRRLLLPAIRDPPSGTNGKDALCDWNSLVGRVDYEWTLHFLQKTAKKSEEDRPMVIEAAVAQAPQIMFDHNGSKLLRYLFRWAAPTQVLEVVGGNVLRLALSGWGSHIVEKAFKVLPERERAITVLMSELFEDIVTTMVDINGLHVWRSAFEHLREHSSAVMEHVNLALCKNWTVIALSNLGSFVIESILKNVREEDKVSQITVARKSANENAKRPCINELLSAIERLVSHRFGVRSIRYILWHGDKTVRDRVMNCVICEAYEYSLHRYAHTVAIACLEYGDIPYLYSFVEQICSSKVDCPPLIYIACSRYGHLVIQCLLRLSIQAQCWEVSQQIQNHIIYLRYSEFGSRVSSLYEQLYAAMVSLPGMADFPACSSVYTSPWNFHANIYCQDMPMPQVQDSYTCQEQASSEVVPICDLSTS